MAQIKCILTEQNRGKTTILKDEIDGRKFNLLAENGMLSLQEISSNAEESDIQLIDVANGKTYKLTVEASILKLEEV